jgi:hypothetical protein
LAVVASRPEQPHREREADESLLRAVVQVSLESPPLFVTCGEDSSAGGAKVGELGERFGAQSFVLEGEVHGRYQFADGLGGVEDAAAVHQHGDLGPGVGEPGSRPARVRVRQVDLVCFGVDIPCTAVDGIAEDEIRIAEPLRKGRAQLGRAGRVAEVDDEAGEAALGVP